MRVIDQIINPMQALLPEAGGWGQWWLSKADNLTIHHSQHRAWLFFTPKVNRSLTLLSLYFRPIQNIKSRAWTCGFCSNISFVSKQITCIDGKCASFSSEWVCIKIQVNFKQNHRITPWNFIKIIIDEICFNDFWKIPIYHPLLWWR